MAKFNTAKNYLLIAFTTSCLVGCDKTDLCLLERESFLSYTKNHRIDYTKAISCFGTTNYLPLEDRYELQYSPHIALGDMDGDGDLDIILSVGRGKITILENSIYQKTNYPYLKNSNNF